MPVVIRMKEASNGARLVVVHDVRLKDVLHPEGNSPMFRPKSDSPAAYSYTCPTGGVRFCFRTDTRACGADAAAEPNDLSSLVAIAVESGSQVREYEYIDVDEESDQAP